MVGRCRHRSLAALALCLLLVSCRPEPAAPPQVQQPTAPPTSAATATPTPTPTPEPIPTPEPPPAPDPIVVAIERLDTELLDNAVLRGEAQRPFDDPTVVRAAESVRAALEAYLNAWLVDADTRFTAAGLEALLGEGTVAALTEAQRRALGELDVVGDELTTAPARTDLLVLIDGTDVLTIAATFSAQVTVRDEAATNRLEQHGTLLFSPAADGWQVDILDVRLDVHGDGEGG